MLAHASTLYLKVSYQIQIYTETFKELHNHILMANADY